MFSLVITWPPKARYFFWLVLLFLLLLLCSINTRSISSISGFINK
ncbi:MAG: hypothetical protein EOO56_02685 [Hymenobacter sp.]|nr:MAG: hypothetical protein EOO56_02685 [Hymenobacter sp.]